MLGGLPIALQKEKEKEKEMQCNAMQNFENARFAWFLLNKMSHASGETSSW